MWANIHETTGEFISDSLEDTGVPQPPHNIDGWYKPAWDEKQGWHETIDAGILETARVNVNASAITQSANTLVLTKYSELQQRKLTSIALKLLRKEIKGFTLTTEETRLMQVCDTADEWITSVRVVQKASILDGVEVADITWPTQEEVT